MIKLSRENWMMLGLVACVTVLVVFTVYIPQGRALTEIRTQIASKQIALNDGAEKAAVVPNLVRNIETMKGMYKDFDRRLPKSKELGGFLQEITAIRKASDLSESRMDTGTPISEELFNTMPIKMRFRGTYLALADFLRRLDSMQRLTRVQRLQITSPRDEAAGLDIELQVNIYFTKT